MEEKQIWLGMLVMAATLYMVRALPLTLLKKEIRSTFIRSFLYYVPYVSLSVMTFPAILSATGSLVSAAAGFAAAVVLAWVDGNLFRVSLGACGAVFVTELVMEFLV
ncbi:MAG: AzlD domain-containing protein [Lachnospiraceae bacterium]|jgi:branched-subunit amino acid transport protein|nr:AzlD domain-containing protein [Lachnospiraceae bacterium]MCI8960714.1 AzlD domain-containing protein [Lachnospiraceae bacterium]